MEFDDLESFEDLLGQQRAIRTLALRVHVQLVLGECLQQEGRKSAEQEPGLHLERTLRFPLHRDDVCVADGRIGSDGPGVDDRIGPTNNPTLGIQSSDGEVDFEELAVAAEVGAALARVDVVVAIVIAVGAVSVLEEARLAMALIVDPAATGDAAQEPVLEVDQPPSAKLGAAQGGVWIPQRNIGPVHNIRSEQPQGLSRVIGVVVGIVISMVVVIMVVRRIDEASGPAISSVSFMAVAPAYFVLWSVLFLSLPRGTSDPGAILPGALVVALVVTVMHAISQLFLTRQIESAGSLYGAVGVAVAIFGWFYFLGRGLAFGFAVNAVLYERIGSVSEFVFGLPGLRAFPRRWPALARFFDLESDEAL